MSQKILVPLDTTSAAATVLAAAIAEARWRGADLVLLRAVAPPTGLAAEAAVMWPDNVAGMIERRTQAEFAQLREGVPAGVGVSVRVEFGAPWQVIGEVAKAEDVALVVMGAHDRRLLDGLLGTTTTRVVNHADRSVLVVRGP